MLAPAPPDVTRDDDPAKARTQSVPKSLTARDSALLASIVASSDDAIVSKDLDGTITSWNRSAQKLFGFTADEAIGQSVTLIIPDDRLHEEAEILSRVRRGERIEHFETVRRHKNGELFEIAVTISPVVDASGRIVGASKIARDLRPIRRAEEALRRTEERYGRLAALLPVGVYSCESPSGRITYFNQYAVRLWGRSPADGVTHQDFFEGFRWYASDDAEPVPYHLSPTALALRHGRSVRNEEITLERPDGERISLLVNLDVMRGSEGSVDGVIVVLHDISALKESERALRDAHRLKDRFLATLSHELRNPLAAIAMNLEVMRRADNSDMVRRAEERIDRQTRQLIRLVDDLLDVSRITQERLELRTRRVDLRTILDDAAESARPDIEQGGHTLVLDPPDPPITLGVDAERMTQVITNLLSNAALYTPSGGTISLTAWRDGDEIAISVTDDGVGIPQTALETIFDMFTQAERSHVDGSAGLGIGLTIVKSVVDLHGGTIDVRSAGPGQGSTFTVRLPVRRETIPYEDREQAAAPMSGAVVRRVLIVDDNEAFLESVSLIVEKLGHEVRTASDGRRAVEVAAEFEPEVVLMDLGMPEMNGFDAGRILQKQPWSGEMTLVALTGWGRAEDKLRTKEAGFDHHLVKPVTVEQLRTLLNGSPTYEVG